jgi:hypothetical protein
MLKLEPTILTLLSYIGLFIPVGERLGELSKINY